MLKGLLIRMGIASAEIDRTFVPSGERFVYINDVIKQRTFEYLHNSVTTCKYTTFTFLPKFLFEFFSKYANLFFLFTGSVQLVGNLSPTSRYGTAIPLFIIAVLTAAKELLEDSKRHVQDRIVNSRKTKVLVGNSFEIRDWRDIKVGDILRIENSEYFPADIVILSSSEPDALCYIETSNLDGETNLKIRQGVTETAQLLTPDLVSKIDGVIKSELPNNSLYTFEAALKLKGIDIPLSPQQLLLRGAQLRNTRWVYGIAVFTGHETKLMMNSSATPVKRTKVELMVNSQIIFLFCVLLVIALVGALGQLIAETRGAFNSGINDPLKTDNAATHIQQFPLNILTFIILFNNLIPLSLIVTLEFVKFALGAFINNDLDMYHEESDTPATARTSTLVEELGQIDYIFSDKTGTLTRNIMEFKNSSIGGLSYADSVPDDKRLRMEDGKEVGWYDFIKLREHAKKKGSLIGDFLTLLAVCHTVIPEHDEDNLGKITYQASSPDEAALVEGAKSLGYLFHTRKPRSITIAVNGIDVEYQILTVNEFNSTRKRMSVLVRCPDGSVKLLIKGADTVIFER